jgi:hypothetical protein
MDLEFVLMVGLIPSVNWLDTMLRQRIAARNIEEIMNRILVFM